MSQGGAVMPSIARLIVVAVQHARHAGLGWAALPTEDEGAVHDRRPLRGTCRYSYLYNIDDRTVFRLDTQLLSSFLDKAGSI